MGDMAQDRITLVLKNANVLTMDQHRPRAEAVAVAGERIAAVGTNADILHATRKDTQVIDCQGRTLLPGFNDSHCHLAGLARKMQDLDCGPNRVSSIVELQAALRRWSAGLPAGHWVRGHGYDDLRLAEGRHPNRHDLDLAVPDRPVWLEHRGGHAAALNTMALELAGVHRETPDPPGGVIDRDLSTAEPTGVLFELHRFLRHRLGNIRTSQEFTEGMRAVDSLLNSQGIISVQDAGADNGLDRWQTFHHFQDLGILSCRITMFAGFHRLAELNDAGLSFKSGTCHLRLGHAKVVLTLTSGRLHPAAENLGEMIDESHRRGFPVAIHCIEEEAIATAAESLRTRRQPELVDRIEHCAEGTPEVLRAVLRSGAMVATQPGFLYHNGPTYCENVHAGLLPHLYPVQAITKAGIRVAFGSDAPVIDPNPWPGIYTAVTRRTHDGLRLHPCEEASCGIDVGDALRMYTLGSAEAECTESFKGNITAGKAADMIIVENDPTTIDPERLPGMRTAMTMIGGRIMGRHF